MKTMLIAAGAGAVLLGSVAIAAQQAPTAPTTAQRPMMPRADTDNDGVITRAEFLAQASARFDRIDANKDGRIDQTERQAMHKRGGGRGDGMGRRGHHGRGMDGMRPAPAQPQPSVQ